MGPCRCKMTKQWLLLCCSLLGSALGEINRDLPESQAFHGKMELINATEALFKYNSKFFLVWVDVRSYREYNQGHIPNAILLEDFLLDDDQQKIVKKLLHGCEMSRIAIYGS